MNKLILIFIIYSFLSCSRESQETYISVNEEIPVSISDTITISRITFDEGRSNAFTDITFFDNQFFLVFRESDKHALGEDGVVKIYNSLDGIQWIINKEISIPGIDLRDPKFAVNGEELSLYIHGSRYENQILTEFHDYNLKYSDSQGWLQITDVLLDNLSANTNNILGNEAWPWRVTWHNNEAYAVSYNGTDIFDLYQSNDGLFFRRQHVFESVPNLPNEATIRVNNNGEFFAMVRRINGSALLGRANNPGESWEWFGEIPFDNFRGPNFLLTDDNQIIFSGGLFGFVYLGIYDINTNTYRQLVEIPSYGDGSYPGMVIRDNILWLSYYTSYENVNGSSIYVAKINLEALSI